jgi:hypothetical protein
MAHIVGGGGRFDNYFRCAFLNLLTGISDIPVTGQTFGAYNVTLSDCVANFATGPGSVVFAPGTDYYLVTCFDQRDILDGLSASAIMALIDTYRSAVRAKGYTWILTTYPPCATDYYTESQEAVRQAVNAMILAYTGADYIFNFATTPGLSNGDDALQYSTDLMDLSHLGAMTYARAITDLLRLPSRVVGGYSQNDPLWQYTIAHWQYWRTGFRCLTSGRANYAWMHAAVADRVWWTAARGDDQAPSDLIASIGPVDVAPGLNVWALPAEISYTAPEYLWIGAIGSGSGDDRRSVCRFEGGYTRAVYASVNFDAFNPAQTYDAWLSDISQMSAGLAAWYPPTPAATTQTFFKAANIARLCRAGR